MGALLVFLVMVETFLCGVLLVRVKVLRKAVESLGDSLRHVTDDVEEISRELG